MADEPKKIVNPDHITYREYKKRLSKRPHQSLILFVSAFFILLLAFLGVAKIMTPDVDLAIGDIPEVEAEQEGIVRGNVDDRLKQLQDEDNGLFGDEDMFSRNLDEKVVIPDKKDVEETVPAQAEAPVVLQVAEPQPVVAQPEPEVPIVKEEPVKNPNVPQVVERVVQQTTVAAPVPQIPQESKPPIPMSQLDPTSYKVYIGSYSSAAQAEVAKGILVEAGGDANVFVKNVNGEFTLQAGSYSSKEKANSVANELLENNFPARVVAE